MSEVTTLLSSGSLGMTLSEEDFNKILGEVGPNAIKKDVLCLELMWGGKYSEEKFPPGTSGNCLPWKGEWIEEYNGYDYINTRVVTLQLTPDILIQFTVTGPGFEW